MTLADASVWIDLLRGRASARTLRLQALGEAGELAVADLTVTEVLQGTRDAAEFARVAGLLARYPLIEVGGLRVASAAARYYHQLRARGRTPRSTIDTLIAARCILDGHALLFSDRDFAPFVELLGLRDGMVD